MKPIRLKIKGLNSFIEEQVVDFNKLTSKGMFGIFGPTGSGKSTILDGITLALYGEISRKSSDFININCNKCNISYEFQISGKETHIYKVVREYKRDKKTNKILSTKCRLSDITKDEIVLCDKVREVNEKCREIIGLSINDFTRTVVLPQGKFSEFLKLEGKSRREMLERLFNLEEYGDKLSTKLYKRISNVKNEKNILEGQMKGYEEYTTERLNICSENLKNLTKEYDFLNKEYENLKIKENEINLLWNNIKELNKYENSLNILLEKKEEIDVKNEILIKGEASKKLYPYIEEKNININKINNINDSLSELEEKISKSNDLKEKISKNYLEYKDKNENELPNLILEKQKIDNAVLELNEIHKLYLENEKLNKYKLELNNKNSKLKNSLNYITSEIKVNLEKDKKIDFLIEELKIDSVVKEKIQRGIILNSTYITLKNQYNNLVSKNKELLKGKEENESVLKKLKFSYNSLKDTYNNILSEIKLLNSEKILSEDELFNLQKEIIKCEEQLKEKNKFKEQLKEENNILNKEKEEYEKYKKKLTLLKEEDIAISSKLENMEEEYHASFLRKKLKNNVPCPVCGSLHHVNDYKNISVNENEMLNLRESKEKISKDILDYEVKLKVSKSKLKEKELNISKLQSQLEKLDNSLDENQINIKKEKLNDELNKSNKYKENKDKLDKKEKTIKEEYILTENNIKNLEKTLIDIKNRIITNNNESKQLENQIKENIMLITNIKTALNIDDFEEENNKIKEAENKRNNLIKDSKDTKEIIDKLRANKDKLTNDINELEKRIENGTAIISEKEKNIQNKISNLNSKFPDNKLDTYCDIESYIKEFSSRLNSTLNNISTQITNIVSTYNKLDKEKESILQKLENLKNSYISNKSALSEIEKRNLNLSNKISVLLLQENFTNEEEVCKCLLKEEELLSIKSEIELFNNNMLEIKSTIKGLKEKLNNKNITEEEYNEFISNLQKKRNELTLKNEERIKCNEEFNLINEKIKELGSLSEKMNEYIHKLSILSELEKIFKGKRFIEYIATSRLKYISKDASRRLYNITNGNYGLEVDDNGKFFIRDYKNGGVSRDTSTLSGGETFLASLSLALSLSAEIQLKGTAPLELFFLDEGFGTLDEDLLEVVMSSLEKIHNDKLKIGIISHVESIKNRVPVKLNVQKASAGVSGSKIFIEFS